MAVAVTSVGADPPPLGFPEGQHHLKAYWLHSHQDEPSVLFYEIKDKWTKRIVEIFDFGPPGWATDTATFGRTDMPDQPWTADAPFDGSDPQFSWFWIEKQHFERVWSAVTQER